MDDRKEATLCAIEKSIHGLIHQYANETYTLKGAELEECKKFLHALPTVFDRLRNFDALDRVGLVGKAYD